MAFSSWFSRFNSSSKPLVLRVLQKSPSLNHYYRTRHSLLVKEILNSNKGKKPPLFYSWPSSLLPLALAVSAGSIILECQSNISFCDSRGISVVGKDSTDVDVKGSYKKVSQEFLEELRAICQDNMTMDYDDRYFHGKPQNSFHKAINIPDVVVFPRTEEEVSKIVTSCNKHKVPIVPYGGATSIEGHTLSPNGGVCIDMSSMKNVKALHVEDMDVVVEPGIGWMELNEYLEPYGLFFPLDPGPGATIGGMCATRCSGSLSVRYGTMRDNVINLKIVLANGDVVKTGSRARKSAAGYDLTRLMIGSEGTLGVITEVTLRLQKIPQYSVVAMCNFPTVKDAADAAIATMQTGIQVSRVELLDEVQVKAINLANGKNLPEFPTLMFEFIGTEAYSREQTLIVQNIISDHSGSDFVFADDPKAKKELWKIRKEALWACFAMKPSCEAMIVDVCVPLSHLAETISRSKQEIDASPLECAVIAHAGDGNFHALILFDPNEEEQLREAERLNNLMVHTALSLEGTCTGEHGVGTGKMKYLEKELGIEALRMMKRIKAVLDPNNIMNPGDSAGGNIAHNLAVQLGAGSFELAPVHVRGYVLLAPFFGGTILTKSEAEGPLNAFLNWELIDRFWRLSIPIGDTTDHPLVNPFGPVSKSLESKSFDPILVVCGGSDLLKDRAKDYARKLKEWGNKIEYVEFEDMQHGFFTIDPNSKDSNKLMQIIKHFIAENSA